MDKAPKNFPNLQRQNGLISFNERVSALHQKPYIFWFTGLSGAGKTTIAIELEKRMFNRGALVYHLDADDLRQTVNADLGFSKEDREQNISRAAGVARILQDAGLIVLATFITPTESSRQAARAIARQRLFREIYVKASLETCVARDPKGFYARALRGEISNYTGIDSLFEEPRRPDMVLDTDRQDVGECVNQLMDLIDELDVLGR